MSSSLPQGSGSFLPHDFVDPDVDAIATDRPLHLRSRYLYVVFVGGMLGTMARWSLGEWQPARHGFPVATLAVNLVGAFCLGLLLESLVRWGPDRGWPRLARLHFGTGFLGSFTTYSALAAETVLLADQGRVGYAVLYLLVSVLVGVLFAWAGIVVGSRTAGARVAEATR